VFSFLLLKIDFRTLSESRRGSELAFSVTVSSKTGRINSKRGSMFYCRVYANAARVARVAILTLMFLLFACLSRLGTTLPINGVSY
jgi:hypothetical protein